MRYLVLFCYTAFVSLTGGITAFVSLTGGTAAFGETFRWFPIAEMLRSILVGLPLLGLVLLLPPQIASVAIFLAAVPLVVFAFASVMHIALYGSDISAAAVRSTLETSPMEALEFLGEYVTLPNVCIAVLLCASFLFLFPLALRAATTIRRNRLTAAIALLLICVPVWFIWHKGARLMRSYTPYIIGKTLASHQEDLEKIRLMQQNRKNLHFSDVRIIDSDGDEPRTYVFIIGESANRHHMSLYGYHRPTTPSMGALAAGGEMLVFTDVASAATHTVPSLRATLLFPDNDPNKDILEARSLIGLFNDAGFETWWLSNQTASADGLTGTAVIAGDALHREFLNRASHEGKSTSYDSVLLPALEKILRTPVRNKAIFIHLLGSHLSYGLRYPGAFARFTDTADVLDRPWRKEENKRYINEYDNSIAYTDKIVGEIMRTVTTSPGRNLALYFSDHGQEVYDTRPIRGQDARNPTRHMLDVPFVCMVSAGYSAANGDFVRHMRQAVNKPFSLANFSQSAAELARIDFADRNPEKSLFSPVYKPGKRVLHNGGDYDALPQLMDGG